MGLSHWHSQTKPGALGYTHTSKGNPTMKLTNILAGIAASTIAISPALACTAPIPAQRFVTREVFTLSANKPNQLSLFYGQSANDDAHSRSMAEGALKQAKFTYIKGGQTINVTKQVRCGYANYGYHTCGLVDSKGLWMNSLDDNSYPPKWTKSNVSTPVYVIIDHQTLIPGE